PGMFVRIRTPIGTPHKARLIAEQALSTDQGQKFVYVVAPENEVAVRYVRVGSLHGGLRVIEQGLKPDEKVIVSGLQQIRPRAKVEPKQVDMTTRTAVASRPPVTTNAASDASGKRSDAASKSASATTR